MNNAWDHYEPTDESPWSIQRVVHLHRRAGLGADWNTIQRDLQAGPHESVSHLLSPPVRNERMDSFESTAKAIGDSAIRSQEASLLKGWWLYRMVLSPRPLTERLTLFWHDHFATSNQKVNSLRLMRGQNETFRKYSLAKFSILLEESIRDPAMLIWLDAPQNRKGACNENLAREIMELFSLGLGNYTEQDIKEAARALTGWTVANNKFAFTEANHDASGKTVFGKSGAWDADDLLQLLLAHPETPRFVCHKICNSLISQQAASAEARESLVQAFAERDMDVGWLVETILRSQAFFHTDNIRRLIVAPVPYMASAIRALEMLAPPPSPTIVADRAARAGQDLFYPPNVDGWTSGYGWITTQSMVMRFKFAKDLVSGRLHRAESNYLQVVQLLDRHHISTRLADATRFALQLLCGIDPSEEHVQRIVGAEENSRTSEEETLRGVFANVLSSAEAQLS